VILIYSIKRNVYIALEGIVPEGRVEVVDVNKKIILNHPFQNSNFEKLTIPENEKKVTVKVKYNKSTYVRNINLK